MLDKGKHLIFQARMIVWKVANYIIDSFYTLIRMKLTLWVLLLCVSWTAAVPAVTTSRPSTAKPPNREKLVVILLDG